MTNPLIMKRSDLKNIETSFLAHADEQTLSREISFALQAVNKSEQLQKCSVESKQQSVLNVALIGLTLNPAHNLAYLVPRYDGKLREMVCTLMPSYQGLIKLLTDAGSITSCQANVIREGDEYSYELGTDSYLKHSPRLGNKADIIGAYAIAHLHDGTKQIEIIDAEGLDVVMGMSESYKAYKAGKIRSCVWVDHKPEMSRKTVIKRLAKYLPKTDQHKWEKVAQAIDADNQEYVLDPFDQKASYIIELAEQVYSGTDRFEAIKAEVLSGQMDIQRANMLIGQLKDDIPNEITHGTQHGIPSKAVINKTAKDISES